MSSSPQSTLVSTSEASPTSRFQSSRDKQSKPLPRKLKKSKKSKTQHRTALAMTSSYLSRLSPVPAFPEYTGPYKVGTIDVELPVANIESPSPAPVEHISTVQYRIFYPCDPNAQAKTVSWLPNPQRDHVSAYTRFLGAGTMLAEVISFFPRILHYISIPVRKNADLLEPPTANKRWPVMIFSHGLGGSRNAYSHIVGSIASHGMIVIAPEHRDGSAPISFIRDVPSNNSMGEKMSAKRSKRTVDYMRLSHTPSPEVEAGRNAQLKIRLWEMGAIHESLRQIDLGKDLGNLNTSSTPLSPFKDMMDVHTPGKITFAGHSFGAATVAQFVKSTFYSSKASEAPSTFEPLFSPSSRATIREQITTRTPLVLLDMWCFPLRAESTRWLWDLPLPCYSSKDAPGGSGVLAVESQAFYKWGEHLTATKRFLSPDPSVTKYDYSGNTWAEPQLFYAVTSAHLSQSDFGILFPWLVKKVFGSEEPERIMKLNVRAIIQMLRNQSIEVSSTSAADMELSEKGLKGVETKDDTTILDRKNDVRGWVWISNDAGDVAEKEGAVERTDAVDPGDAVVNNEVMRKKDGAAEQFSGSTSTL